MLPLSNVFPLASYHVAATVSASHFLDLHEFSAGMVSNCRDGGRESLRWCMDLIWSEIPHSLVEPSLSQWCQHGASHVQVLVDVRPTSYQENLLEAAGSITAGPGGASGWTYSMKRAERREIHRRERISGGARQFCPSGKQGGSDHIQEDDNLLDCGTEEIAASLSVSSDC